MILGAPLPPATTLGLAANNFRGFLFAVGGGRTHCVSFCSAKYASNAGATACQSHIARNASLQAKVGEHCKAACDVEASRSAGGPEKSKRVTPPTRQRGSSCRPLPGL